MKKPSNRITAQFEFSPSGYLKVILLNAENDGDEAILEHALLRLLKPDHFRWIKRLLKKSDW